MSLNVLLGRQSDCINCPDPQPCSCSANQDCFRINRDCYTCSQTKCVAKAGAATKSSGGVSKGALAGGIIGALVFLALSISLFLWYRRTSRLRKALATGREFKPDVPAPAATVLNRPDPTEKSTPTTSDTGIVRVYSTHSNTTINLDPNSQGPHYTFSQEPSHTNPFDDNNSIQTAGTEGTNVIPIALVSADSHQTSIRSEGDTLPSTTYSGPVRPARSPELNLNLDHVNVSNDNLRAANPYTGSTRSGVSAVSSRNSYMSGASYSSDFLHEAPMIMTPTKGAVRQVLGVVKAEVISAGSLSANNSTDNLKPPPFSRPTVTSPLAATSFGPSDVLKEADESQESSDPFSDKHSSTKADYSVSPAPTTTTFGQVSSRQEHESSDTEWIIENPQLPWAQDDDFSRPSSMSTQAGSVADIASATIVNVGLASATMPRSPYRTTMGRLISPTLTTATTGSLHEQQARALAHAHAQAQAQGLDKTRPVSGSSVLSATSTRADSILESFPFVPPSPISNRPIRSPPVSPLAQQSFSSGNSSPLAQHTFIVAPPSPLSQNNFGQTSQEAARSNEAINASLPAPSRRTLGFSTASQLSTASSGLGSFPFQIDSGSAPDNGMRPPSSFNGRQRASLDTLALTSDLSSYPLGFDRDSMPVRKNE